MREMSDKASKKRGGPAKAAGPAKSQKSAQASAKPSRAPAAAKKTLGAQASQSVRDDDSEAYLVQLGQRVRSIRAVRGMSRKVLAQSSGVSERYIAQLESGQGNASIMLLRRVAAATGAALEDLVVDPATQPRDWMLVREMMRKATPQQIAAVKAALSNAAPKTAIVAATGSVDRVALIGLRGAGKSTLGRLAAEELGWPFVELNREIEIEAGFSISEIFSLYGQEGYRRYEQRALQRLIETPGPMVIATGGGVVADPVTFAALRANFFTVWIEASPAEHMSRVRKQGDLRPMGDDKAAMSELITILTSRAALYAQARGRVDTSGLTVGESLAKLIALVQSYCARGCPLRAGGPQQERVLSAKA
jgi:XRE family aerobic/anaerobic benzoate catabolism transcriptional regulator